MLLRTLQNLQEKFCARVSFLKKLQIYRVQFYQKRDSSACFPVNSTKFLITPFLKNPLDGCFCINTFRVFKNNVFSGWVFSTESNICDEAFSAKIVNSWYCYNQKQSSDGVLEKRCSYKFCKIHKKTSALTCVFSEAADLQSLTLSKREVPIQMFSCEFCEISHNTKFKAPEKLIISTKKRHCTVDVRPGSRALKKYGGKTWLKLR